MKIIGLIPTRLNSSRLPHKSLLPINGIPMIVHVYKRSKLAKKLDDLIICCDDKKIISIAKKYNIKLIVPLTDAYSYYHGSYGDFCSNRGLPKTEFWTNGNVRSDFKKFINIKTSGLIK